MPEPRHLRRAPIREAVIDIRIPALPRDALDALRDLARGLNYPVVHEAFEVRADFAMGPGELVEQSHESRPSGFRAMSETDAQVVQFRLNGLGVSRLEPYESWSQLLAEAHRIWAVFRETLRPEGATRLGLRYINHIRLPYPLSDLGEYFLGLPDPPEEWPQTLSAFLLRQTLDDGRTGATVNVMHALADDVDENRIGVIFDIDAYVVGSFGVEDDELWGTFAGLRDLKNRIFFSGLTETTLSLFE